ncbi:hypothetical protein VNO77_09907 [Canavalia gladiata]|uniref:Alcohol dehydrogenase-like C-terminal domain-containing protein n=1 Tax=Canavalia gladiata TaxID=3824 RepID=A0AAN9MB79_CANGL
MGSSTAGKVIRCKAAVAWEAGKPLVIEEVEVAPPQANEVRLKILFTSLCHTDVYFWEAKAAEGARLAGASRIIGVDLNSKRFIEAKKFGVTEFVNPKDYDKPVQEVIAEMTGGGVDRSVECTGNINAMISAFECVHDGWGVAVLVGVPNKDDAFKTHPINVLNEKTLKGTFFGNYKPRSHLPSVVEMYMNKELELEKFITHEVSFSEINKAFEYMLKGESLRCIIRMTP